MPRKALATARAALRSQRWRPTRAGIGVQTPRTGYQRAESQSHSVQGTAETQLAGSGDPPARHEGLGSLAGEAA